MHLNHLEQCLMQIASTRAGKRAQRVEVLAAKAEDLSSIPRTHMVKGDY